jgi:hypothetical protein
MTVRAMFSSAQRISYCFFSVSFKKSILKMLSETLKYFSINHLLFFCNKSPTLLNLHT